MRSRGGSPARVRSGGMSTGAASARALTRTASRAEGERLARRTGLRVALAEMLANGLGAIDVFLLLWLVLPTPPFDNESTVLAVNAAACAAYLLISGIVGNVWGKRTYDAITVWLREDRPPTEAERAGVLRQPLFC